MFACVYFEKDATLSVVHEKDKDLSILTQFEKRHLVEMRWRMTQGKAKKTFAGVIIKVGDNKESLTEYATKAYNEFLKGVAPGTPAPEEMFTFETSAKASGKRERVPTKRIAESKKQDEELNTPKKKKKQPLSTQKETLQERAPTKSLAAASKETPKEKVSTTVTSLLKQFNETIEDSMSNNTSNETIEDSVSNKPSNETIEDSVSNKPSNETIEDSVSNKPSNGTIEDSVSNKPSNETIEDSVSNKPSNETIEDLVSNKPSNETIEDSVSNKPNANQVGPSDQQVRPSDTSVRTDLTETWRACHGALNLLNEVTAAPHTNATLDSPTSTLDHSSVTLANPAKLPVASPGVISILRGVASSEFADFVRQLADYMEHSSGFLTKVMNRERDVGRDVRNYGFQQRFTTSNGTSFLSQLGETDTFDLPESSGSYQMPVPILPEQPVDELVQNVSSTDIITDSSKLMPLQKSQRILVNSADPTPSTSGGSYTDKVTPLRKSPRKQITDATPSKPYREDQLTPVRKSPRKQPAMCATPSTPDSVTPSTPDSADQVKLLPTSNIVVCRLALRKACVTATQKKGNAAFQLMYNLMGAVFSIEEMAISRGLGIGRVRPGDEHKPVLNAEKIQVLKEYVHSWCKKNVGVSFPDKMLNDAVTERSHYARKQLKKLKK